MSPGLRPRFAAPALVVLAALAVLPAVASAQVLQQRIANPIVGPSAEGTWFGFSVDISGDNLIVGAPADPFETPPTCGVALYERTGATWSLDTNLLQVFPSDTRSGWAVAIDGDWAAFNTFGSPGNSGEVRVLQRLAGTWFVTQVLTAPVPTPGFEFFGGSLSIDGDLMAIGSAGQGGVWLFRRQGTVWVELGLFTPPSPYDQSDSHFGESVAVSVTPAREALIVGQPLYTAPGSLYDGVAHIYVDSGSGWSLVNTVLPSVTPSFHAFTGRNVALDGDVAVVGAVLAFEQAPPMTSNGAATILRWNGSGFATSLSHTGEAQEFLGWAVAADGDRVYIGRPGWTGIDSDTALDAGRVTVDRWTGSTWTDWPANGGSFHRIANPVIDRYFGQALAAADGRLVVGMPEADTASEDQAGAICVLDVSKEGWKWSDAQVGGLDTVVGSTGPARLIGEGSLGGGDGHRLHLHDARPSTLVAMFVGVTTAFAPFKTGILVPNPMSILWLPTNAAGDFHITTKFPNGVPAGIPLWHHPWWPDPAAPAGVASSNAIMGVTP